MGFIRKSRRLTMVKYRVTKFNPNYRNTDHQFVKDEWTSLDDVGKEYGGVEFMLIDYLAMEKRYLTVVDVVLDYLKCTELKVSNIEKYDEIGNRFPEIYNESIINSYNEVIDGCYISKGIALSSFITLILREHLWADLRSFEGNVKLEFGYDYYMYFFVAKHLPENVISRIRRLDLFVELL